MPQIRIQFNPKPIELALNGITGKAIQQSVARSIKRTSTTVAKLINQEFRTRRLINMNSGRLKKEIRVFNHLSSSSPVNKQYAEVHISSGSTNLWRFFARTVSAGRNQAKGNKLKRVTVSELGQSSLNDKAFIFRKILLARTGNKRLPVKKLWGPSAGKLAQDSGMLRQIEFQASAKYEKEFTHNLEFFTQKAIQKTKL